MKNYIQFLESTYHSKQQVYYHGSGTPIVGKFKPTESKRGSGVYKNNVYFFTDDIEIAEVFAKDRSTDGKGFITKVHLDIHNILDLSEDEIFVEDFLKELFGHDISEESILDLEQVWNILDEPKLVEKIKSMGYDSVKLSEPILKWDATSIAVFDPDKIEIIS